MDEIITVKIKDIEIKLKTKAGVFSKNGIDNGSKLLIENVEIKDGNLIADLGCGIGIIGFVAAKQNFNGHVHLLEDHIRSVELAEENVQLNKLRNVEVFLSDLFSAVGDRTYHMILSNPSQQMGNQFLEEMAIQCLKHLKSKGEVYWVVQNHLKTVIERYFNQVFGNCEVVARGKGHVVLKAQNTTP